jgi:ABC-type branched-subunit amino acid transport system permease subunit
MLGLSILLLVLAFPQGIAGSVRERLMPDPHGGPAQ